MQYLLNEVDSSTAEKIRAELEADAELREYVWQMEDAFASMACAAPPMEPPAGLSQRILQIERNDARGPSSRPRPKIIWLAVPWALAACLAIACVVSGPGAVATAGENRTNRPRTRGAPADECSDRGGIGDFAEKKCAGRDQDRDAEIASRGLRGGDGRRCLGQRSKEGGAPTG